jgi:hypothetical protein
MSVLKPSAVVVVILDDDINRTGQKVYAGAPKPWFQLQDGRLIHHNSPVPAPSIDKPALRWLAHSYLAVWVTERFGLEDVWQQQAYVAADNDPIAVTCAMLERLKQTVDAASIPLYVVMLYGGSDRLADMNVSVEKARPIAVRACANRMAIPTIDLLDSLISLAKSDMTTYRAYYHRSGPLGDGFGHLTADGNAFVARQIEDRLLRDGVADRLLQTRNEPVSAAIRQ